MPFVMTQRWVSFKDNRCQELELCYALLILLLENRNTSRHGQVTLVCRFCPYNLPCVYICMCACLCACEFVCMHIHSHACVCMCVCLCVYVRMCMFCRCMYMCRGHRYTSGIVPLVPSIIYLFVYMSMCLFSYLFIYTYLRICVSDRKREMSPQKQQDVLIGAEHLSSPLWHSRLSLISLPHRSEVRWQWCCHLPCFTKRVVVQMLAQRGKWSLSPDSAARLPWESSEIVCETFPYKTGRLFSLRVSRPLVVGLWTVCGVFPW